MPETLEIDTTKANELLGSLYDALIESGGESMPADLVRDETRRLAVQITKFIPPANERQGKEAVYREIKSLFGEADQDLIDDIGSKHGVSNIDTYIGGKDGQSLRLLWGNIDPTGDRMRERHLAAINNRGKVPKGAKGAAGEWRKRVIVPKGVRWPYIQKIQKHVGRWKASWAQVARDLGVSNIAQWIRRHMPTPMAVSDTTGLQTAGNPSVTFGSRSPGNRREEADIRDAVNARRTAMKRRIELILSGYSKDVAQGMRQNSRAIREKAKERGNYNGGHYSIG